MSRLRRVAVGRVGRPHGVRGEVRVEVSGVEVGRLQSYSGFCLEHRGAVEPILVESVRGQGRTALVKFSGCDSPEEARELSGAVLCVDRCELPPLEDDEYYHADLLGCRVVDEGGRDLGRVGDVLSTGSHDVLVIEGGGREWMLPLVAAYVPDVDVEAGVIRVRPPQGLPR